MTKAFFSRILPIVPLRQEPVRLDARDGRLVLVRSRLGAVVLGSVFVGLACSSAVAADKASAQPAGSARSTEAKAKAKIEPSRAETSEQVADKDGWTSQTVVVAAETVEVLPAPEEAGNQRRVRWLDGFQRQASHLGMGRLAGKPAGKRREAQRADYSFGLHRFIRTAAAHQEEDAAEAQPAPLTGWDPDIEGSAALPDDDESSDEIVVIGLSAADLKTARAHGFTVMDATEVGDSGTFQRLKAPAGIPRRQAERMLYKILPSLSVMPNYTYSIFMGTPGEGDAISVLPGADRRKATPASAEPCSGDTCFGPELIAWNKELSKCTKNVRIGIIDTSFDVSHPAFKRIKAIQKDFLGGQKPTENDWHGTAILSLLAGDPSSGTPGLVPDATFLLATAFQTDAAGNASTDSVRLLAALAWLDELDVDIVNMSFSGRKDPAFAEAIARMSEKGVMFVAAAGNMGPTAKSSYPAAYPHVIAVTAVNRNGENYRGANRGKYVDVAAPGVDILTALPDGQQGYRTGTSFAVPFVTAILATRGGRIGNFAESEQQLLAQLAAQDLGAPGRDPTYGVGLVRAPEQCPHGGDLIARGAPAREAWSQQTTLVRASTGGPAP